MNFGGYRNQLRSTFLISDKFNEREFKIIIQRIKKYEKLELIH